jgi:hypothetical protein
VAVALHAGAHAVAALADDPRDTMVPAAARTEAAAKIIDRRMANY